MKLLLLPGLDGTGELFKPILYYLEKDYDVSVLSYNDSLNSYKDYVNYIKKYIPKDDFVIVAESFSGYILYLLLQDNISNLKGVVFVASFLRTPRRFLLKLSKYFINFNIPKIDIKFLLLNGCKNSDRVNLVYNVVNNIPKSILLKRLELIKTLNQPNIKVVIKTLYLRASRDFLVPKNIQKYFLSVFKNLKIVDIKGGHLLLQSNLKESAKAISDFVESL